MMQKKHVRILFALILGSILLYTSKIMNEEGNIEYIDRGVKEKESMEYRMHTVSGMLATLENQAIEVDLGYFENLKYGTKYNDIVAEIGEFTGTFGSGIVRPYYAVGDVYIAMFFSQDEEGEYDRLLGMSVCNSDEKLYDMEIEK